MTRETVDTRERILSAAEELFAARGYSATSIRAITDAARVNLGAVNYHFGTKEMLLQEVVRHRIVPVNQERLRLLDACEAKGDGTDLEAVLRAFVEPVLLLGAGSFPRLLGRLYSEPVDSLLDLFREEIHPVVFRFHGALERLLPELSVEERYWTLEFTVGSLVHMLMVGDRLEVVTLGHCSAKDSEPLVARIVCFCAAGMRAAAGAEASMPAADR